MRLQVGSPRRSFWLSPFRRLLERAPVEISIDLPRRDQMLQLFEPTETSEEKHLLGHSHPFEDRAQLTRAQLGWPATAERGEVTADLIEGSSIAAIVAARPTEGDGAAVKDLSDDASDFANAVILLIVPDV